MSIVESLSSSGLGSIVEAVLAERSELGEAISRLRLLCANLLDNGAPASPAMTLEEFETELLCCFAAEEAEEFFGSLTTDEPRLIQRGERLQAEHEQLIGALGGLLELAESAAPDKELSVGLTEFLDRLEEHEHAENALMQEFLLLDIGTGD